MYSFSLIFAEKNKNYIVDRILGDLSTIKHLHDIGFSKNVCITINAINNNGVIVSILNTKLALDLSIAKKIYVKEFHKDTTMEL